MANITTRRGETSEAIAGPWDPLRALDPFRLVRDLVGGDPFAGTVPAVSTAFVPDIEVKETKDSYDLTVDLPGVRGQDVEISITGNRLTLTGKREEEVRREDDRFFVYERAYGTFSRSFVLPEGADVSRISADLRDGVLHITVPKRAEMQARRIEVGGKGAGAREIGTGQPEQQKEQGAKEGAAQKPPEKKAA